MEDRKGDRMSIGAKRVWSYLLALFLSVAVLALIGQVTSWLISLAYEVDMLTVVKSVGVMISVFVMANGLARFIRTNSSPISIGATNIPNVFYDPYFEEAANVADESLFERIRQLEVEIEQRSSLISEMVDQLERGAQEIESIKYTMDIFVRHHKNASRLVRSLTNLMIERKQGWLFEFCNNVLSECVTTLAKDRADKSSTLYKIQGDQLVMFAYNRIEFSSTRSRVFARGEGFAGYVWETEQQALEEDVSTSEHFQQAFAPRHSYGSILGCPIKMGDKIMGVLCIQSEETNGFEKDDLVMTQFYADIVAQAFYSQMNHDILQVRTEERSDSDGSEGAFSRA